MPGDAASILGFLRSGQPKLSHSVKELHKATQSLPPGWEASVSCCRQLDPTNITLSYQEIVTCTFTDTRLVSEDHTWSRTN